MDTSPQSSEIQKDSVEVLLPSVETDVFEGHPEAAYWVGFVAAENNVYMPAEYEAAGKLRANVYVHERKFLDSESVQPDGTEQDGDDGRSLAIAVLENGFGKNPERLVGTTRLIVKRDASAVELLPVELMFPEAFQEEPAPPYAVEASRFIARHPDRLTQHLIALSEVRCVSLAANELQIPYIYAVVEKQLGRFFSQIGMEYNQLCGYRETPEYANTLNTAIRFKPETMLQATGKLRDGRLVADFFNEEKEAVGVGYFDGSFTGL